MKISELRSDLEKWSDRHTKASLYNELFSPNSEKSLYKEVKLKISESLSDDEVSLVNHAVEEGQLGLQLKVDNEWMDYNACSSGQQTYVDLKLISKLFTIIGSSGLLILDEMLANVDTSKLDPCLAIIRSIECKNLIMTSHNSEIKNDFDSQLNCELVDNCTIIS
jgi:ABC-type lipoprotein export system ATPase subunit